MKDGKAERRPGEFELIARLFAPLAQSVAGAFALTDDVAMLPPRPGYDLVLKADAVVEGVDFFREDPAAAVAQKALRVNLSDLAAKGAEPNGYLLTLLLPEWPDLGWLEKFASGLARDQAEFGVGLFGGDMSGTPGPLAIAIAAHGYVPTGAMIRRAGARPGDLVFVSGTIGDSAAGLAILKGEGPREKYEALVERYRLPQPRLRLGEALREVATASLDISDGLVADLEHIATTSGVQISIHAERIPLSEPVLRLWGDSLDTRCRAATAGDDYEIGFTAPARLRDAVFAAGARGGVPVHEIGTVERGSGVEFLDPAGNAVSLKRKGFVHF